MQPPPGAAPIKKASSLKELSSLRGRGNEIDQGSIEIKLDTNFDIFYKYDWPGNVRELRNLVERISILSINENSNNSETFLLITRQNNW